MAYNLVMSHTVTTPNNTLSTRAYMLAPAVWLVMLYIATALTAGVDATPEHSAERILFEVRHVAMHLLAFAVQAWLIAHALRLTGDLETKRSGIWLIALVLVLGIGQEALQGLYRHEIRTWASLWDLTVDASGGAIGWWWYRRQLIRTRTQYLNAARTGL